MQDTVRGTRRQATEGQQTSAKYVTDKGLYPGCKKNCQNSVIQKQRNHPANK